MKYTQNFILLTFPSLFISNQCIYYCCLVDKSYLTLQTHGLYHTRLPSPSFSPWVCSNLFAPTCVGDANHFILFWTFLLFPNLFFPASGSFPMCWVFFPNELVLCTKWPKYCSLSFSPSRKYWGLISFRINWFDLIAVQGTLKSLLQHHNLKVSIFWIYTDKYK